MQPEVLVWVFFGSQGVTDNTDLTRSMILCQDIVRLGSEATVEKVKNTTGYRSCLYDLPDNLISDTQIQKIIDFKI